MRGNQQENTIWQRNLTNTVIIIVQRSVLVCVCGHFQQHFSLAYKTKKVWTNDVIEELIEMVEARSVIYDIYGYW
jgi:hypothetical protein